MASDSESTARRFHDDLRKAVGPIILHFIARGLTVLLVWAVPLLVDRVLGSEATLIGVLWVPPRLLQKYESLAPTPGIC
jgi:hypothetical protein